MEPIYVTVVDIETQVSRSFAFDGPRVRIGREADNDLHLPYSFISRWHAVIELDARGARLRDLGSANPFCFDGIPLEPGACLPLSGRHSLTIGSLKLKLDWHAPEDGAVAADPSAVQGTLESKSHAKLATGGLERIHAARRAYDAALRSWERELAEVMFDLEKSGDYETAARIEQEFAVGPGPRGPLSAVHAHENMVVALATELMPDTRPPNDAEEEREFISRLAQVLRTFAVCFIETQRTVKAQATEIAVTLCPGEGEPLAADQEPEELLGYLLDWRSPDDGRAYDLIQRFQVVLAHQRGYVCGALGALRRIGHECRPEQIARQVDVPWPLRAGMYWRRFIERHERLFGEGDQRLSQTLRGYLADEYCEELARSGVSAVRGR
jgi:predicted component of type VI protein secretion system